MIAGRALRVVLAVLCAAQVGCGSPTPRPQPPAARQPTVPVSPDPPIPVGQPIHPPHQPRELPLAALAYVVDSRSDSVYEYDLGRGRFLGPAPRVVTVTEKVVALPGYPTVVSREPPQRAALAGSSLYVAGGNDGTVAIIPVTAGGLGEPRQVPLPAVTVTREPLYGGGTASNASPQSHLPFVNLVVPLGDRQVVAVTHDTGSATSVAYLVDAAAGRVVRAAQLPGGVTNAMAPYGHDHVAAVTNEGRLLILDERLAPIRQYPVSGNPGGIAVDGDQAVVSSLPAPNQAPVSHLELVDLVGGATRQLDSLENPYSGPVAVGGGMVWWALSDLGRIRAIPLHGSGSRTLDACRYITSLAAGAGRLLATCIEHNQLAVIDPATQSRTLNDAGGFPFSVAL